MGTSSKEKLGQLTEQQLKFCEGVLAGQSLIDAHRAAYPGDLSDANRYTAASRMRCHAKIAPWLDAAMMRAKGRLANQFDNYVDEVREATAMARSSGNVGAMMQGYALIGKALGHLIDRHADVTPRDPMLALEEMAKIDPEYAQRMAEHYKLDWTPPAERTSH